MEWDIDWGSSCVRNALAFSVWVRWTGSGLTVRLAWRGGPGEPCQVAPGGGGGGGGGGGRSFETESFPEDIPGNRQNHFRGNFEVSKTLISL